LVFGLLCAPPLQALLRFYPDAEQNNGLHELRRQIVRYLKFGVGIAGIVFVIIGGITASLSYGSFLSCLLLSGVFCIDVIRSYAINIFNASRNQRPIALWTIAESFVRPLAAIILVVILGANVENILIGYGFASFCIWLLFKNTVFIEDNSFSPVGPNQYLKSELLKYSLPLVPLAVVGWITALGDRYIIGGILGPAEVGIYAAGYGLISRPFLMGGGIIEQILRPLYFEAVSQGRDDARKIFNYWLIGTIIICAIGCLTVILLEDYISILLLAGKYRVAKELFPWIAVGYSLLVISYVYEKANYAYKNTRYVFITQSFGALACILFSIPLAIHYGVKGVAMAIPAYFGVQLIVSVITSRRTQCQHMPFIAHSDMPK